MKILSRLSIWAAATWLLIPWNGCKSGSTTASAPKPPGTPAAVRPSVPPPAFKVFHQDSSTFTLVTKEDATDDEIAALIFELRDAAHSHSFDQIHISQKAVDTRDPTAWFHIYRGAKCASEKYSAGKPPCGNSYHAAGDYTFGGGKQKDWDDGVLLHGEDHEVRLWDPDAPYTASPKTPVSTTMTQTTQLVTERLLLRPWEGQDEAPFAAINADPDVMRFFAARRHILYSLELQPATGETAILIS